MTSLREQLARRMCERSPLNSNQWKFCLPEIDAILDDMIEIGPDDNMEAAGIVAIFDTGLDGPDGVGASDARAIFQAMFRAARKLSDTEVEDIFRAMLRAAKEDSDE